MVCPECGHSIPEGQLLCEKCGAEIKIVPEFDIEIENSINETLSSIVEEIIPANEQNVEKAPIEQIKEKTKEEKLEEEFFKDRRDFRKKKSHLSYMLLAIVIILAVAILAPLFGYRLFSVKYQLREAEGYISSGEYEAALSYVERAISLKDEDYSLLLKKAEIYRMMSQDDEAIDLLIDTINNKALSDELSLSFYDELISIFIENEEYNSLARILGECTNEEVISKYFEYTAQMPSYNVPTGNYDEATELIISAPEDGLVLYTLNGEDPLPNKGIHYNRPIILHSGEYNIKAIYVNTYGVSSDIASAYYLIDIAEPDAPIINPESGDFKKPFYVEVEYPEDCTLYYTTDGSDPNPDEDNERTQEYKDGLFIDWGTYNFAFLAVSKEGGYSQIVRRSYNVSLNTKVTDKMAEYKLIETLTNLGHMESAEGVYSYQYDSLIEISDYGYYYKLDEYLTDKDGNVEATGFMYAVDAYKNIPYALTIDSNKKWGLIPLG